MASAERTSIAGKSPLDRCRLSQIEHACLYGTGFAPECSESSSTILLTCGLREMMMRKLILGTASVLALGIGGAVLDYAADADDAVPNPEWNMPSASATSHHWLTAADLSKDDIRWA